MFLLVAVVVTDAQNHGIYGVFSSDSENHGIYNVFLPGPSKNTGIYAVFSMLQEELFSCQRHKTNVNYSVFVLGKHQKSNKNPTKSVQNAPPKSILEF